jgi:hypothetical protein
MYGLVTLIKLGLILIFWVGMKQAAIPYGHIFLLNVDQGSDGTRYSGDFNAGGRRLKAIA